MTELFACYDMKFWVGGSYKNCQDYQFTYLLPAVANAAEMLHEIPPFRDSYGEKIAVVLNYAATVLSNALDAINPPNIRNYLLP